MKSRNLALIVLVGALLLGASPVFADQGTATPKPQTNIADFIFAPFKLLFKKIEEKKENKDTNKNLRNEIIERQQRAEELKQSTTTPAELMDTALKLENISVRLESRIQKIEADGLNLDAAKKFLSHAQREISTVQDTIARIASSTPDMTAASSTELVIKATREILDIHANLASTTQFINHVLEGNFGDQSSQ